MAMVGLSKMQKRLSAIGVSRKALSVRSAKAFTTLMQTVKPTVFWEVGDTIGAYSWLALEHSESCKALLFEANPDHYLALLKTIHHKQLHRAQANNLVVSPTGAGMPVELNVTAATVGALPGFASSARDAVETMTFDDLLAKGYAPPDMIRLDAPDAARLVMDGARQLLETCSPLLIVKTASPALVRYLEGLSYRSAQFDQDHLIFISVYF